MAFTHIDKSGNPSMVDVGDKSQTTRTAIAGCTVQLPDSVMTHLEGDELSLKKGPVFQTAIIAGVMAAKKTGELIPLCHPLAIENCKINIKVSGPNTVDVRCKTRIYGKTGVEMEALTGASIAALTIYDMCKAMSHDIIISDLKLISKSGGKRDFNREV
jgi:cyclic pyranopterin monophosphate synthase